MARPQKKGLDYFPQDTDIFQDRKVRRLLTEFGATGFIVYEYIKTLCYKENGYWAQFDDGFCFDVADVLKSGITENSVEEILKGCFRMSLFDAQVFKVSNVITSAGIQKRYTLAKRNGVIAAEMRVITAETPVIAPITPTNGTLSTQSKVKKKESKEKEITPAVPVDLPPPKTEPKNDKAPQPPSPPKPPKSETKTEFWDELVDVWFKFYETQKGANPTFGGKEGKELKTVIERLRQRSTAKGHTWDCEKAIYTLRLFLDYAAKDEWIKNNLLLTNLVTKFDKITALRNAPATTGNQKGNVKGHQDYDPQSVYAAISAVYSKSDKTP